MKKIARIIMLVIFMVASLTVISMAANVSINLSPDKEAVEQGQEVIVSLVIKDFTREGTSKAVELKLEYDTAKLEYKGIAWKDGWTGNISTDGTGLAAMKSEEVSQEELIAEVKYKVKENATKGTTIITAKDILTSSDGDEVEADNVETQIEILEKKGTDNPEEDEKEKKLTSIEITNEAAKLIYEEGEKFDTTGMKVIAKYSDGTSEEITEYTYEPSGELTVEDTKITISYTEDDIIKTVEQEIQVIEKEEPKPGKDEDKENNDPSEDNSDQDEEKVEDDKETIKEDSTQAEKDYPYTGVESIVILIAAIATFALIIFVKYRKYKQI